MTPSADTAPPRRVAFLGGGNMAAALISGLLSKGWSRDHLAVAERDDARRAWLQQTFGVVASDDAQSAVADADATVLAVKPQQMEAALAGLTLAPGSLALSIAAGVRLSTLRRALGDAIALVRCMPNTPALAGAGATALFAADDTAAPSRALAQRLMDSVGVTCWVESEAQLDAVTALSGSGPAYFFLLAEAMTAAGTALGLAADVSATLARQTLVGAGRLVEQDSADIAELRRRVTSKGGTTEAALASLENHDIHTIVSQALQAAADRSRVLGGG